MKIIDCLIESVQEASLPDEILIGAFLAAVVKASRCGLATVIVEHVHGEIPVRHIGSLHEKPLRELCSFALSEKPLEACLGMAAINASVPTDPSRFRELNAYDILLQKARGKNLTMVGHFPFADRLKPECNNCWILELEPEAGDLPAHAAADVIHDSDIVAITASAFSNHTIDRLLDLSKEKYVMILGPTAPLSEVLFDFGVDAVAGAWVTDIDAALLTISQGASFRQIRGVSKVFLEK